MCAFSKPSVPEVSIPEPPPAVTPPAAAPQESDPAVQASRQDTRQRRMAAAQENQTLVTGGQGLVSPASTGNKQAFGV